MIRLNPKRSKECLIIHTWENNFSFPTHYAAQNSKVAQKTQVGGNPAFASGPKTRSGFPITRLMQAVDQLLERCIHPGLCLEATSSMAGCINLRSLLLAHLLLLKLRERLVVQHFLRQHSTKKVSIKPVSAYSLGYIVVQPVRQQLFARCSTSWLTSILSWHTYARCILAILKEDPPGGCKSAAIILNKH